MHNVSAGVVLSNVSLVLRSVTHSRAGLYACSAANSRGESVSQPPLRLRIQCNYRNFFLFLHLRNCVFHFWLNCLTLATPYHIAHDILKS